MTADDIRKFWTVAYTCGCGLYVHPKHPLTNIKAIHIEDCQFNERTKSIECIREGSEELGGHEGAD